MAHDCMRIMGCLTRLTQYWRLDTATQRSLSFTLKFDLTAGHMLETLQVQVGALKSVCDCHLDALQPKFLQNPVTHIHQ